MAGILLYQIPFQAKQLNDILSRYGFTFTIAPQTNQLFVNVPDTLVNSITQQYDLLPCGKPDSQHSCLRFCTSWSTQQHDIDRFEKFLQTVCQK